MVLPSPKTRGRQQHSRHPSKRKEGEGRKGKRKGKMFGKESFFFAFQRKATLGRIALEFVCGLFLRVLFFLRVFFFWVVCEMKGVFFLSAASAGRE
jgi:hypothetical protein